MTWTRGVPHFILVCWPHPYCVLPWIASFFVTFPWPMFGVRGPANKETFAQKWKYALTIIISLPSLLPYFQPRIFVFVEKKPGESLGLYLVPFEEEPLTGLYVKNIVAGKSASRLQVFDAGICLEHEKQISRQYVTSCVCTQPSKVRNNNSLANIT